MLELSTPGQLETIPLELALQSQLQRRFGFCDLRNLAEICESAIGTSQSRPAIRANENDSRARLKLDRTGTGWTIGGKDGYTSPPAV